MPLFFLSIILTQNISSHFCNFLLFSHKIIFFNFNIIFTRQINNLKQYWFKEFWSKGDSNFEGIINFLGDESNNCISQKV